MVVRPRVRWTRSRRLRPAAAADPLCGIQPRSGPRLC